MEKYDMLLPKIEFLEKDFIILSERLEEDYNPSAITALANVGTVLLAMKKLEHDQEKTIEKTNEEIHEELMDAEKYYEKWVDTKEPNYKQMAKDELRHADFFIKQARMVAKGVEQDKIQSYIEWYNQILSRLA